MEILKNYSSIFILLVAFAGSLDLQAQTGFMNVYESSSEYSFGFDICTTPYGAYVSTGFVEKSGDRDFLLIKTNNAGEVVWQRAIGDVLGDEQGRSVCVSSDSMIYATGWRKNRSTLVSELMYVKCDLDGNLLWSRILGGSGSDHGWHITEDKNQTDLIMTGYTFSSSLGVVSNLIMRINQDGDTLESKMFGGDDRCYGHFLVFSDSGYIICGHTSSFSEDIGMENHDIQVYELDSNLNILWGKAYGTPSREEGNSIVQTSDGNYIITGTTNNWTVLNRTLILKIDSVGNIIWSKTLELANETEGLDVVINESDEVFVIGYSVDSSFLGGSHSILVSQIDADGNHVESRRIEGNSHEKGYAGVLNGDTLMVTGYSSSYGSEIGLDMFVASFMGMNNCESEEVTVTMTDRVVSENNGLFEAPSEFTFSNLLNDNHKPTLNPYYKCSVGLASYNKEKNIKIFPNPAIDYTTVVLSIEDKIAVNYEVHDIRGSIVLNGTFENGSNNLSVSTLSPGFYTLHLNWGMNKFQSTKLIICE